MRHQGQSDLSSDSVLPKLKDRLGVLEPLIGRSTWLWLESCIHSRLSTLRDPLFVVERRHVKGAMI